MLTSAEGAYTAYLEARMGAGGVNPALVRTALQQMGFDDATVAAMTGETNAYASPFSSSLSSGSTTSTSSAALSSVKRPGRLSRLSTTSSIPFAPSVAGSERGMGGNYASGAVAAAAVAKADDSAGRTTGTAVTPGSSHESPAPPSIICESKQSSSGSGSGSSRPAPPLPSAPAENFAAAAPPPLTAASALSAQTSSPTSSQRSRSSASFTHSHVSAAHAHNSASTPSVRSHAKSSVPATAHRDGPPPASATALRTTSREDGGLALSPHDCDVLADWVREYEALLLSSAVPRRATSARTNGLPRAGGAAVAAVPRLPAEAPYDEFHAVLSSSTCSVVTAAAATASATRVAPVISGQAHKEEGDGEGSEDGATSSSASSSSFTRTDRQGAPHVRGCLQRQEDSNATAAFHADVYELAPPLAPTPQPFCRYVVPKAKASSFVPVCGVGAPRCTTGRCRCCNVDMSRCRQPYREAQDARLARAAHTADRVKGGSRDGPRTARATPAAVSSCRARQLDAAERTQHTALAAPMSGRRGPVMHQPVGPSVQPRSGLQTGRVASTLSNGVKTDRVRLARYYQRAWSQQERHLTATSRDAVWDARYALLSCTGYTS